MRAVLLLVFLPILLAACSGNSATRGASPDTAPEGSPGDLCTQTPSSPKVSLPADDTVHNEALEWWYWTGHLTDANGNWYGFEETFFRPIVLGQAAKMLHVAVTDIATGNFYYTTFTAAGDYPHVANGFNMSLSGSTAVGGNGHDVLHGDTGDGYVLDLDLVSTKAPVLQHESGYTDYSFGGYTYYYSREHMQTSGTLTINSLAIPVTGTSWFDHQYGSLAQVVGMGWDWFALQLDDNTQIMLYMVHAAGSPELVGGSLSGSDCAKTGLDPTQVTVTKTGDWPSPHHTSSCSYPSGWDITVNGKHYVITPTVLDQELATSTPIYWEGACTVTGDMTGRAYVELTGYCQ